MSKSQLYSFKSIAQLVRYLGEPDPLHPLITVINYDEHEMKVGNAGDRISLDFYKISFKKSFRGRIKYGQGYYDFEEGGLTFLAPRQIVTTPENSELFEGYSLYFHPDFIRKYPLMKTIHTYGFFYYSTSEALFLSEEEKQIVEALYISMIHELSTVDAFSQDILVSQIEQFLNYSNRFYHRQFATRKVVHDALITQLERFLSDYFNSERALMNGLPTVQLIADELQVSPHYLGDMLRSLTGQNTQQHIHSKLIDKAKEILSASDLSVSEVAYQLGFEHPQSFSKIFKRMTSLTPLEYRRSFE